jgi:hypothetical protein
VVKADFLGEVQPHECEARNDKGPRRMPQPFLVLMGDFVRDSRGTACHRHHGWWCRVITVAIGRIGCPAWCNFARGDESIPSSACAVGSLLPRCTGLHRSVVATAHFEFEWDNVRPPLRA